MQNELIHPFSSDTSGIIEELGSESKMAILVYKEVLCCLQLVCRESE